MIVSWARFYHNLCLYEDELFREFMEGLISHRHASAYYHGYLVCGFNLGFISENRLWQLSNSFNKRLEYNLN